MPTPLLHGAAGLSIYLFDRGALRRHQWRVAGLILLAAVLPDVDFIPGFFLDAPNRFHSRWTHSIGFALLVGALFGAICARCRIRVACWSALACFSHPALDMLVVDQRPPFGVPILWPFRSETYLVEPPVLSGIRHGMNSASATDVLSRVFSMTNVKTLGVEAALGSVMILVAVAAGRAIGLRRRRRAMDSGAVIAGAAD